MDETFHKTETISLWRCLHDGGIKSLKSDLMARTFTLAVDVPFHWEFNKLPPETRFIVIAENVHIAETFEFEPWPCAENPPIEMPWQEAEEKRKQNSEKGRLISASWNKFMTQIEANEDYEIITAELNTTDRVIVLSLGLLGGQSDWLDIKIHAEGFHFAIGKRKVSVQEFEEFGSAYWNDFAARSKAQLSQMESTQ